MALGKVGLVGAGAVGSFYGLMLKESGEDMHFHLRSNFQEVARSGFSLIHHSLDKKINKIKNASIYRNPIDIGVCDWIIIATKATANADIPDLISPMVGANTSFLTLQNGMGNVENLLGAFGKDRTVLGGLCFTCVNRTSPTIIESLLPGYVQFGQIGAKLTGRANLMVNSFKKAGIKIRRSDSLDEALWRKLCWNVPFNGLSIACGGITTDVILHSPKLRERARTLMFEIQAGAKANGILIEDSFLEKQFILTQPMGPYRPSSLIDFQSGKPVEVEAILGEALKRSISKGLQMNELRKLFNELKILT